jgi:hypothetical protein
MASIFFAMPSFWAIVSAYSHVLDTLEQDVILALHGPQLAARPTHSGTSSSFLTPDVVLLSFNKVSYVQPPVMNAEQHRSDTLQFNDQLQRVMGR